MNAATADVPNRPLTRMLTRVLALGRAEAILLLRNRTALFTALAVPLLMVGGLRSILEQQAEQTPGLDLDAALVNGVLGIVLLFVVYYNLTAAYVARRGELVLKRLRTGEAGDLEILAGTAVPSVALALLQFVVLGVAGAVLLDLPVPVNPLLMVAGLALIITLLIALAALSSAFTRTVESAGITTLPVLLISQFGSGLLFPLTVMPDQLATVCRALPATPALQLLQLGWFGTNGSGPATDFAGSWAEAAPHLALAILWTAASGWAARRWFCWEPRR
ncbi:ABC transporter permease [Kitasatospora atroaurantiaca]|uniref:Transport permease protein n=1 Tax=Kitasatospora atroaurantiaca TaxID=285545 RepID=A0A561ESE9_9ACTN|nr:ABC transporter permease [Kitasatospora atroaurantiaca]TWE18521.1 ABC-2 type transport system permease protein [Kitasatospora atroaurantiaca]